MRKELLESRGDWKFVGKLTENIKKPTYAGQQLFGAHTLDMNNKRSAYC